MSSYHCRECGSEVCGHGNCPECNPCKHCFGGDRQNKYFPEDDPEEERERPEPRYLGDVDSPLDL